MGLGRKPIYFILLLMLFVLGCTSIGGWVQRDEAFYQRAMPAHQAPPLPVEIARDIERITEDGVLIESSDPLAQHGIQAINAQLLERNNAPVGHQVQRSVSAYQYAKDDYVDEVSVIEETSGPLGQSMRAKAQGPLGFSKQNITARQILEALGEDTESGSLSSNGTRRRVAAVGGKTISYIVKLGDTLMKIAFEKHGDYLRWREIYTANRTKMENPRKMHVGTNLTINNVKDVYIHREGQAYNISKNDTLKSISQKLYGTPDRWQDIWKNNPQLIRNPKKIYAGFTLYYPQDKVLSEEDIKREPTTEEKEQ